MPVVEATLPDKLVAEIDRLVEEGEFVNQEEAMEELLGFGISAMSSPSTTEDEFEEGPFNQAINDQQDPAMLGESDDEYTY